ncbi:unnamed protein product [Brassica rapa subsp. trilocularis]
MILNPLPGGVSSPIKRFWGSRHTLCRFSSGEVHRKHSRGRWFTVWKLSSLLHICIMVCSEKLGSNWQNV